MTRALPSGDRLHFQVLDNFLTAVLSTVSWRLLQLHVLHVLLLVGPGKTETLEMRVNFLCVKVT